MSKIAFVPDQLVSATKDFEGIIVIAEYIENVRFTGHQLHIEIQTEEYDKNQHEWYAPSDKLKTKWAHFINALSTCGAMKDTSFEGETPALQMENFAKSLLGMKCRFVEYTDLPAIAKNRDTGKFEIRAIIPTEYMGKTEVGEIQRESVSQVTL